MSDKLSALIASKRAPDSLRKAAAARRVVKPKPKTHQLMPGEPPMPGEPGYRNPLDTVNSDRGNV